MTEIMSMQSPNYMSVNATSEIAPLVAEGKASVAGEKIESMFASMLVKSLRATLGEEGLFPGDKSDALGSMFDQYLGDEIARGKGLGLSRAISAYTASTSQEQSDD